MSELKYLLTHPQMLESLMFHLLQFVKSNN